VVGAPRRKVLTSCRPAPPHGALQSTSEIGSHGRLPIPAPTPPPTTGRVLVVDDDDQVRVIFVRYLTTAGFDVVAVSGAAEGLRVLRDEGNISLVLLDFTMPEMNGLEFRTQQLADERISGIPVVIVTGSPLAAEDRERLQAVDYLAKPVGREELIAVVARYRRVER
jgi:CheY-like chemotaxis protein